jgi:hypothetical protein
MKFYYKVLVYILMLSQINNLLRKRSKGINDEPALVEYTTNTGSAQLMGSVTTTDSTIEILYQSFHNKNLYYPFYDDQRGTLIIYSDTMAMDKINRKNNLLEFQVNYVIKIAKHKFYDEDKTKFDSYRFTCSFKIYFRQDFKSEHIILPSIPAASKLAHELPRDMRDVVLVS